MITVGIPRALAYYQYYPMWRTFFTALGAEVVVSPPTTQRMLADGAASVVADTCLPAKVFLGHINALTGKCDYIFIPSIRSVRRKVYNCAKFLGLPDMTRAALPQCPPILDAEVDINKGMDVLQQNIYRMSKHLTSDKTRIKTAIALAWQAHKEYRELMVSQQITPPMALTKLSGKIGSEGRGNTTIALIGHPYMIYDELVSHGLVNRLGEAGCRLVTAEMLAGNQIEAAMNELVGGAYWTWEEEVVGAGSYYLAHGVDGVIGIAAFGCGPDSMMMNIVQRRANRSNRVPFMNLTLEEHTAETGVLTRLEAFLDMIQRRQRRVRCG